MVITIVEIYYIMDMSIYEEHRLGTIWEAYIISIKIQGVSKKKVYIHEII